jgi:hypothetical protein
MKTVELLEHQAEFINDNDVPFLGLVGGFRSGKTVALCYKALMLANLNTMADGALLEPTYGMLTRVLVPTFNTILWNLGIKFTHNKSDNFYDIDLGGVTKRIWLLSAENYEKSAGMTLSWFGIDEVDTMSMDVAKNSWNMMTSRLTKGEVIQGFCTSTPEGFNFLYYFFEENKGTDRRLIRASTYSNPFIDEIYFENLKKTHTEQQLEAYLHGHFVNMKSGNIYYSFNRNMHETDLTIDHFEDNIILIGQDFNVGNCASVVCVVSKEILYIVDEIVGGLNTENVIDIIKERYPNRAIYVYPDSSGKNGSTRTSYSDVALLKQAGFKVLYPTKNPPIKDRIASVNAKLKSADGKVMLKINTSKCKNMTKTLEQQGYVNGLPDKASGLDHLADALGYLIHYNWPVNSKSSVRQIY